MPDRLLRPLMPHRHRDLEVEAQARLVAQWMLVGFVHGVMNTDNCSVAEATDCTLVEASSEASPTMVVSSCDRSAVAVSVLAEASSSLEAKDTVSTISPTAFRLSSINPTTSVASVALLPPTSLREISWRRCRSRSCAQRHGHRHGLGCRCRNLRN